jgi:hypothetical protein
MRENMLMPIIRTRQTVFTMMSMEACDYWLACMRLMFLALDRVPPELLDEGAPGLS